MQKWAEQACDGYHLITQENGATLGYSPTSGINIIYEDGYAFKDLNRDGKLDIYEDWRQPIEKRVDDLVSKLSIEEIAGLMLYSNHQAIPATSYDISDYDGKPYAESGAKPWDLSDNQKRFLKEDHLRHILITIIESPEAAARWNNQLQAYVEGLGHGIPANNSSDPRHSARADAEFNAGGGGKISMWPGPLGLAATFSPAIVKRFGEIASEEYRALGFATALSPQIDIATDPRWYRCHGTFGEDPELSADLARAYCDGFQTSKGSDEIIDGWGNQVKAQDITPVSRELASKYFTVVDTPADADIALVFIESPNSGCGYSLDEMKKGESGYIPISLQYNDYTARKARPQSIAGGDPYEKFTNRSYLNKSTKTVNKGDMDLVIATKKAMGDRPVIVSINLSNPMVLKEIEPYADALFVTFDIQYQVILDLVTGRSEPSALLPMQMPADMDTVEEQAEDTPRDMRCYKDSDGNVYDFAYGLNWKGVINDERVKKYK